MSDKVNILLQNVIMQKTVSGASIEDGKCHGDGDFDTKPPSDCVKRHIFYFFVILTQHSGF